MVFVLSLASPRFAEPINCWLLVRTLVVLEVDSPSICRYFPPVFSYRNLMVRQEDGPLFPMPAKRLLLIRVIKAMKFFQVLPSTSCQAVSLGGSIALD